MPTVSVIIPSYNRAWFMQQAIDSVLSQDSDDFELIVVDDGSTDCTHQILDSYPGIRVIKQDHRGVSAARNTGIRAASGQLIAFLDSDDLWLPGKLAQQTAFFKTHQNALICQTEEIWIRNGLRVNPRKRHTKRSGMIFEDSVELCLVSPSAVMVKLNLLNEVGWFDETLPACEDYDLWLRITCRFPVHLIHTPLVVKRGGHEDQLSRLPGLDRFRIYALRKVLKNPALTPKQRMAAFEALSKKCAVYAGGCFKRGRIDEAWQYLRLQSKSARRSQRVAEAGYIGSSI